MGIVSRVDAYQRRHRWAGLPLAVLYKSADDQGGYLAAQVTYYGFVAAFPLLREHRRQFRQAHATRTPESRT
jgi:membrane protein